MKGYIIALLVVAVLFGVSLVYKDNRQPVLNMFPINKLEIKETADIYLILYFSMNNCLPCLEIIETLNRLPENYIVIGLVPEEELKIESELREKTNAKFELKSLRGFKKFLPNYAPSLFGVDKKGSIFFILPSVPGEPTYFKQFFDSFMLRSKTILH